MKKIKNALISVFHKDGLEELVKSLDKAGVSIYSTGGTYQFICDLGFKANRVEDLTSYPSILGGRVKTLHPKVFGGILARRENQSDNEEMRQYEIPHFDLIVVDLYPFEKTIASTNDETEIIEKIDIGGISLIRAAAKNYKDVVIIPSMEHYTPFIEIFESNGGATQLANRKAFAAAAFRVSSGYDTAIFNYFNQDNQEKQLRIAENEMQSMRYGENPHQEATFYGNLDEVVEKLHGKEISYNNLLDIDAAIRLIADFDEPTIAVLKHNNACGIASHPEQLECWKRALAGDPISAFGGIIVCNTPIQLETAEAIDQLFYEVLIAPDYNAEALAHLQKKKTRRILKLKQTEFSPAMVRTALNGYLWQTADLKIESAEDMKPATKVAPTTEELHDLVFANKVVKHTKSNAMVIVKGQQLIASGVGETSRVDAFKQAIEKAGNFKKELSGAVLASDAFFPFPDNVEIAKSVGINAVVQPGGSIKDQDSIDYCNANNMAMCFTGTRHFKH